MYMLVESSSDLPDPNFNDTIRLDPPQQPHLLHMGPIVARNKFGSVGYVSDHGWGLNEASYYLSLRC